MILGQSQPKYHREMRFATRAIRVAQNPDPAHRAVTYPIFQSSTFAWTQIEEEPSVAYSRVNNPNRNILEEVLASLEGCEYCTVFSSGMAAVVASLSFLEVGDHVVLASDLYGGTIRYVTELLPKSGITWTEFDSSDPSSLTHALKPTTKAVIFEGPTNPTLAVCDIQKISEIARSHGAVTIFDNTFASPALQQPLALGVDIVVHSTTKYISGHSDVIGGAMMTHRADLAEVATEWIKNTGASPSPFDCWLSLRGLKTLELRMERHCANAQRVAEWLESNPHVKKVYYPGLASHPTHSLAKQQMSGFGGMLSFDLESEEVAKATAMQTKVFLCAESLGGVESLIGYPRLMSHGCLTEEQRLERGVSPAMLRLSVGIENIEDLIEDLDQAIKFAVNSVASPAIFMR